MPPIGGAARSLYSIQTSRVFQNGLVRSYCSVALVPGYQVHNSKTRIVAPHCLISLLLFRDLRCSLFVSHIRSTSFVVLWFVTPELVLLCCNDNGMEYDRSLRTTTTVCSAAPFAYWYCGARYYFVCFLPPGLFCFVSCPRARFQEISKM